MGGKKTRTAEYSFLLAMRFYLDQLLLADSLQEQETHQDLSVCVCVCVCVCVFIGGGQYKQLRPCVGLTSSVC